MKMKAAVLHEAPGKPVIEEVDIADPGPGEVRVRIAASSWSPNCGHCFYCNRGQPILCEVAKTAQGKGMLFDGTTRMAMAGKPVYYYSLVSSHAEYNIVPEQAAVPLPREFPLDRAALLGCAVMTGYGGAVNCARVTPESSVMVVGCGAVGLSDIQGTRIVGASIIVGIDINPLKLEWAERYGATHVVDASTDDPMELVDSLTAGRGADYAIEAVGQNLSIRQTLEASCPDAHVVILGKTPYGEEVSLPFYIMMGKREIVRTSYSMSRPGIDFQRLANLYMSDRLLLDGIISLGLPLEEINTGFDELVKGNVARSLVLFDN